MKVTLRESEESDRPILFEYQREPEGNEMAAFPPRDEQAFAEHWQRLKADDTAIQRTIVADGDVAGDIGSWIGDGERLVGYWLGKEFWGRGIATEALKQFIGVVEERPLSANVAGHNVASIRVLEKCGFVAVGGPTPPGPDGIREVVLRLD
ncbi:MAG TPA: GNAT family N-acetyltransferase [Actinomycetota bacterium]